MRDFTMSSSEVSSEGDVELSLGLTLGGRSNVKKYTPQPLTGNVGRGSSQNTAAAAAADFDGICCGDVCTDGSPPVRRSRQMEGKKEQIESQRMEKKRQKVDEREGNDQQAETNPNSNPNPKINLIPNHNPNSNVIMNMIPNPTATSSATTPAYVNSPNATAGGSDQAALPPYGNFPVMPMQYSYHPYANGYGFPCMVPWYMNVSSGQDGAPSVRNVFQPVPSRSFHTFQGLASANGMGVLKSGGEEVNGEIGGSGGGGSINRAHSLTASQGSSFSAVSEFQSPSQQGGSSSSSDTRGHINHGTEEKSPLNSYHKMNGFQQMPESAIKQFIGGKPEEKDASPRNKHVLTSGDQAKKPMISPMPEMPCVSTTGNGPNGRKITGFLYRYNKTEVSIVCVCHGNSFSPAEFIKHAGGTDVSHPLRHIVIVPS